MGGLHVPIIASPLHPSEAYWLFGITAVVFIALAILISKLMIRDTKDFLIAARQIGQGFAVASIIASWTWAMAVLMSSGQAYAFGVSGLWWFTIPNGLAVIAVIPFAIYVRRHMPHGYTLSQYIYYRFNKNKPLYYLFIASMLFGCFLMTLINLKGTSVVISTVFGMNWRIVPILAGITVLLYSVIGGLWHGSVTATIKVFFVTAGAGMIVLAVLDKVGGVNAVFHAISNMPAAGMGAGGPGGAGYLHWYDAMAPAGFGITLALGLLSNTVSDQTFWQRIWSVKSKYVASSFLWGGAWFYVIPVCLGILGLVGGAMRINFNTVLHGDVTAVGPYVVSHIGLPTWMVVFYAYVILIACFAVLDAAFLGAGSVISVDVVKRFSPNASDGVTFFWTRFAMAAMAIISIWVIWSGVNFDTIVLTTYALKTSVLIPLMLAVFWDRVPGWGIFWGVVGSIVVGMPIYVSNGLLGTLVILVVSGLVPLIWAVVSPTTKFDRASLQEAGDALAVQHTQEGKKAVFVG